MLPRLLFLLLLNGLDILSTKLVLRLGAREGNPAMAYLFRHIGFWPTAALKMTWVALLCLALWKLREHRWVSAGVSLSIALFIALLCWHSYLYWRLS